MHFDISLEVTISHGAANGCMAAAKTVVLEICEDSHISLSDYPGK
jgi:hypothetical protein